MATPLEKPRSDPESMKGRILKTARRVFGEYWLVLLNHRFRAREAGGWPFRLRAEFFASLRPHLYGAGSRFLDPQKTLKPECRQFMSILTRSSMMFPFERSPAHRGKDLMTEYPLQVFRLKKRGHMESRPGGTISIKTAVRTQDMEMGIESKKIAEGLHAITAPGTALSSGPVSWKKTSRDPLSPA